MIDLNPAVAMDAVKAAVIREFVIQFGFEALRVDANVSVNSRLNQFVVKNET
jgi:erythromycin esterase-like protein